MPDSHDRASRLARIRAKLEGLALSGMQPPGPPLAIDRIEAFEADAGVMIPTQLRCFAAEIGLGHSLHPFERWLDATFDPIPGVLAMPCPLDPTLGYGDYDDFEDPAQGAIALRSEGGSGPYTLLVVSGPTRGQLLRYDMDTQWCQWIERASPLGPADFFDWYENWLDLVAIGARVSAYGTGLLGSEAELSAIVADDSLTDSLKQRALVSLGQRPELSDSSVAVIRRAYEQASPAIRAAALPASADHSGDPAALLYAALDAPEPELRHAAVRELGRRKPEGVLVALARASEDSNDQIAAAALIAIEGSPHVNLSLLTRLFERPGLRQRVVSQLGTLGDTNALPLLARALDDQDPHVRRLAGFSITAIGHEGARPLLTRAIAKETEGEVRQAMTVALHRLGPRPS